MTINHMPIVTLHMLVAKSLTLSTIATAYGIRNSDELEMAAWSRTGQMSGVDMIHPSTLIGSVALHLTAKVGARSSLARGPSEKAR